MATSRRHLTLLLAGLVAACSSGSTTGSSGNDSGNGSDSGSGPSGGTTGGGTSGGGASVLGGIGMPKEIEVTDANDATQRYVFKPQQVNEYLTVVADPGDVDLTPAAALDLSAVPSFADAHIGPLPNVPLKYSEGNLVQ